MGIDDCGQRYTSGYARRNSFCSALRTALTPFTAPFLRIYIYIASTQERKQKANVHAPSNIVTYLLPSVAGTSGRKWYPSAQRRFIKATTGTALPAFLRHPKQTCCTRGSRSVYPTLSNHSGTRSYYVLRVKYSKYGVPSPLNRPTI